jgi:exonuclease III
MAGDNKSIVRILTLNVNGINKASKRTKLCEFLKLEKIDIAFLQETYLTQTAIKKAKAEWEVKAYGIQAFQMRKVRLSSFHLHWIYQ